MRLINVKAFLARDKLIRGKEPVDRRTKVLEFRDDEATNYAILSHRWFDQEVNYEEMVDLAKMNQEEREEIRQRDGYRKILDSCEQARRDGYEWLWVDTCCIDKRSSAELSEAINSMFRWYKNSRVCYAYLHDVSGPSIRTKRDKRTYPTSNGWPEWFSRGWTLQEMIAPSNVQFFNQNWRCIGDKKTLAHILADITRVPKHILTDGLSSNRPCVAQIISWAADRMTTRAEDKAYCLLGLLDVNMPMLYGEGMKAFHRLQLEIIRTSNDQSIFAWDPLSILRRSGSILADDPAFFRDCSEMELMDPDEFIQSFKDDISREELHSIEEDRFGVFPITNRGIQIWLPCRRYVGSRSVFMAWLPCRYCPSGSPVAVSLALWQSNYYRYFMPQFLGFPTEETLQFRQVYLTYQDRPHPNATFEIDDSAITEKHLTYCGAYPSELTGNILTLTGTDFLCVKVYLDSRANCRFAVGFGQCFGQDWIHFVCEAPASGCSWKGYAKEEYRKMLVRGPEHARSMAKARSRGKDCDRVWVKHTSLLGSAWTVRTSCVVWEGSGNSGVKIEVLRCRGLRSGSHEWTCFDIEGASTANRDMRALMLRDCPLGSGYGLLVDGVFMKFSLAPNGIKLGDYGQFTDSKEFCCEGNIFDDLQSIASKANITPREHKISDVDTNTNRDQVTTCSLGHDLTLYEPFGLSLPSHHDFNSLLTSLSTTQFINRYLVTRVIQCAPYPSSRRSSLSVHHPASLGGTFGLNTDSTRLTTPLCTIVKPLVWHRDEDAGSTSLQRSGHKSRTGAKKGMVRVKYDNNGNTEVAKRGFLGRMFS